jgi:hypothetical protein
MLDPYIVKFDKVVGHYQSGICTDIEFAQEMMEIAHEAIKYARANYVSPWTIASINQVLRGSYDEAGVLSWWARPRNQLKGKCPLDVWEENTEEARDRVGALAMGLLN